MSRIDPARGKAAVFFGYVLLSSFIGERFPFSRFSMFSSDDATLSCLDARAEGREADYRDYTDFRGRFAEIPPQSTDAWEQRDLRRRLSVEAAAAPGAGAVRLEIRVCRADVDSRGAALECRAFWSGEARRR